MPTGDALDLKIQAENWRARVYLPNYHHEQLQSLLEMQIIGLDIYLLNLKLWGRDQGSWPGI